MKSFPNASGRTLLAAAALATLSACKEAPTATTNQRAAVRRVIDASASTFEGHSKEALERLSHAVLFTDISHEDCELIATALSNPNPGATLRQLQSQAVMPGMHLSGSDAGVSGQQYIAEIVRHCREPGRYMSCATIEDDELLSYAAIVEEYISANPNNSNAPRMRALVRGLRLEVSHRQLLDRARAAGFVR